jgi:hypothetical protein
MESMTLFPGRLSFGASGRQRADLLVEPIEGVGELAQALDVRGLLRSRCTALAWAGFSVSRNLVKMR